MFQTADDSYKLQFQNEQAKNALLLFLQEIALQKELVQRAYSTNNLPQELKQPQVFFSYAWGEDHNIQFQQLQTFLKILQKNFEQAGVTAWFDLSSMVGNIEEQMRGGIQASNLILLMGTELYAQKTATHSSSNVKKELEFSLQKSRNSSECTLVPLVLESKNEKIFPSLGNQFMYADFSNWLNLLNNKNAPIRNMESYIKALTSIQPLGLLPIALGFNKTDYKECRQTFKQLYQTAQTKLTNQLKEIYGSTFRSSLIVPVRHINFKDIEYNQQNDRLGQGSFGTVYKGKWNKLPVAIKEIHGTLNKEIEKSFNTEAEVMMRANSNWVVRLYGIAEDLQKIALVMELMPKGSLNQLLHNGQDLPWYLRCQIAQDITHGLILLHNDNILHRDLKSENILLDERLRAKLSDFGLSKIKSSSRSTTKRSQAVGTEGWMAPELFLDLDELKDDIIPSIPYSTYSDIYSYGIVLWEIATRKIPFEGFRPSQIEKFVKGGKRPSYPQDCEIPENFKSVVKGACEQKPEERLALPILLERLKALEEEVKVAIEETPSSSLLVFSSGAQSVAKPQTQPIPTPIRKDEEGKTALHNAVLKGDREMMHLLINNGADLNVTDKSGYTPLHYAAFNDQKDTVKLLLDNKCDPTLKTLDNATADELTSEDDIEELIRSARKDYNQFRNNSGAAYL